MNYYNDDNGMIRPAKGFFGGDGETWTLDLTIMSRAL